MRRGFFPVLALATAVSTLVVAQTNAPPASGIAPPASIGDHDNTMGYYPPLARARNEQGTTRVYYVINADGGVGDASVENSSGFADLDAAAIDMVKAWRFKPATKDGKPIATSAHVNVVWKLTGPAPAPPPDVTTVYMTPADYPPAAKAAHEEGFAIIMVYLDEQGNAFKTDIQKSTGFTDLDTATTDLALHRWHFTAAQWMGKPATSGVALAVVWSLTPEKDESGKAKD